MFGRLFNALLYIMLFADVLERRFPAEFQRIIVSISYNCIYLFSRLQILLSQTNTRINTYIDSNPRLLKIKNDVKEFVTPCRAEHLVMQEFIRDGKSIQLLKKGNMDDDNNYDFGTVSYYSDVDKCVNTRIVYKGDDDNTVLSNSSDIKFILMEFIDETDSVYKIDLKTDKFNYNVVGNKFNRKFFIYYIRKYFDVNDKEFNLNVLMSLKIIDHEVNTVEVQLKDDNEFIEIEKNGYNLKVAATLEVAAALEESKEIEESELVE